MDTQIYGNGPEVNSLKNQLEEYSFLDKTLLEKTLICNRCRSHLNVSPILYRENLGNICGRCSFGLRKCGDVSRQHVYEALMKNLTFPCANKKYGCIEVLKFDDIPLHERNCRFPILCPLYNLSFHPFCPWKGNPKFLCDHLKSHPESFLNPPHFEWPQDGKNMLFFTNVGNQVIIVGMYYKRYNKTYECHVMVNGTELDSQCFMYHLELSNKDNSNSIILRRNRLEPLLKNYRCTKTSLEVDFDRISEMLQNSKKVFAKFNIIKKSKKEIIQITAVKDGDLLSQGSITATKLKHTPDEEMLDELECPVCREFMLPPIYICTIGHSICSDCKTQVHVCPSCRSQMLGNRNYTLEKLTQKVKYPCRNREIGCSFATTSDKIRQHETHCKLSENPCILRCGWKGQIPGVYNHFLDKHFKSLLEHNTAIFKDLKQDKAIGHYFLYVMGELFCLSFKNCGELTIKYNIQHIGYLEPEPKYVYTMQFSPKPETACRCITITNVCQTRNDNLAESLGPGSVSLPGDLLKDYVFQNQFCYIKINVAKIC